MELRLGKGCYLLSMLEILPKLNEEAMPARLFTAMAGYRPQWAARSTAIMADEATWQRIREVGYEGENTAHETKADVIVACGDKAKAFTSDEVSNALKAGKSVYLQGLDMADTDALLKALKLPGTVLPGTAEAWEWDVFRHRHPLTTGMTNNYLYWMVEKAKLAPWTSAPTHPEPDTARIQLEEGCANAVSLTRRGALTVYTVGSGTLVLDHLRWELPLDEPERPRRYVRCLLTNLGVPLLKGIEGAMSQDFETAETKRERGHF